MTKTPFAIVFPGQGSQSVGMLDAWGDHPVVREVLAEASTALGEDLGRLIHDGPKEALALTVNTQPVMLVAGIAAYRVWLYETGYAPAVLAGHSLGEYSALVAAGVLTLSEAVPLVRFRAQAMQEAVPVGTGAMAVIMGMTAKSVIDGCQVVASEFAAPRGEVVEAVNFNDPGQTVIAGNKASVERACDVLKTMGAKRALPLPVSAPFHSSLMRPAAERLRERLAPMELGTPAIPVVNNIDVSTESDPIRIKDALVRQAAGPVRWVECVQAIRQRGVETLIEAGPGKVLAGLCKRIDPQLKAFSLFDPLSLKETQEQLQ